MAAPAGAERTEVGLLDVDLGDRHDDWHSIFTIREAYDAFSWLLPHINKVQAERDPTLRILDAGCGSGAITLGLALHFPKATVVGFDLHDNFSKAKSLARQLGLSNVAFEIADVRSLTDQCSFLSFDVVYAHHLLSEFPCKDGPESREKDAILALGQLKAVTKPGGFVAARTLDVSQAKIFPEDYELELRNLFEFEQKVFRRRSLAADEQVKWARQAGFTGDQGLFTVGKQVWSSSQARDTLRSRLVKVMTGEEGDWPILVLDVTELTDDDLDELMGAFLSWHDEGGSLEIPNGQMVLFV